MNNDKPKSAAQIQYEELNSEKWQELGRTFEDCYIRFGDKLFKGQEN